MTDTARPFAFEDLPLNDQGKRIEPEAWGPIYSKPAKAPKRVNDETRIPTNCASGQKGQFSAAKHRAKLAAEFHAVAAADRRAWASGTATTTSGKTIADMYKLAMKAKRDRLARGAHIAAGYLSPRDAFRKEAKPHYVLRDGQWRLAA